MFTIELAQRARLPWTQGEPGTDHTGASIESRALGEVALEIGGEQMNLPGVVAVEGPSPFGGWGIGGFLSPQKLHPSAYTVLDLIRHRLVLVEGDLDAVSSWLSARYSGAHVHVLPRAAREPIVVRASIEPYDDVRAVLDTGSFGTDVARVAVPGLAGAREASGFGLSGTEAQGESVADQILRATRASRSGGCSCATTSPSTMRWWG